MSPVPNKPASFQYRPLPCELDLVIVGNGPSALVTAFALGYTPYYAPTYQGYDVAVSTLVGQRPPPPPPHPDQVLHEKLAAHPSLSLFDHDLRDLALHCQHNVHSRAKTPLAALLDTLEKPNADTNPGGQPSRLIWVRNLSKESSDRPVRQLSHAVLGKGPIGGSWFGMAADESDDDNSPWTEFHKDIDKVDMELEGARTLSYATDLELPGFPFADWLCNHRRRPRRTSSSSFDTLNDPISLRAWSAVTRPLRRDVARYYRDYAVETRIDDVMFEGVTVDMVEPMEEALRRGVCACTEVSEGDFYQNMGPVDCQTCSNFRYLVRGWRATGYNISKFSIRTQSVVLATGTFETPRHLGVPGENENPLVCHSVGDLNRVLSTKNGSSSCNSSSLSIDGTSDILPVLIVGTGLSAADAIIRLRDADVPLLHAFRSPDYFGSHRKDSANRSLEPKIRKHRGGHQVPPLAGCPKSVYPDYARLWALMKKASSAAPTLSFSQAMSWVNSEGKISTGCCANIPRDPRGFKYLGLADVDIKGFGPVIPASESTPVPSCNVFLSQSGSSEEYAIRVCAVAVLIGKCIHLSFLKGSIRRRFMRLKGRAETNAREQESIYDETENHYLECGLGDPAPCDPFTYRLGSASHTDPDDNDSARGIYVVGALAGETFVRFGALAGPVAVVSQLLEERRNASAVKSLSRRPESTKYTPYDIQLISLNSAPFDDGGRARPTKVIPQPNLAAPSTARPISNAGFCPIPAPNSEDIYPSLSLDAESRPNLVAVPRHDEAQSLPDYLPGIDVSLSQFKRPNVSFAKRPSHFSGSAPLSISCAQLSRTATRFSDHSVSRSVDCSPFHVPFMTSGGGDTSFTSSQ